VCLLRGTTWVFKQNSLRFLFKGLIKKLTDALELLALLLLNHEVLILILDAEADYPDRDFSLFSQPSQTRIGIVP
jgi:hypothetical protein